MAHELLDEISKNDKIDVYKLSSKEISQVRYSRWKARTNLLYLANKVLGKDRISERFHGALIDKLQKFPKPTEAQYNANEVYSREENRWIYTPVIPNIQDLPGKRRRLILDFRSAGKTTINCECHTAQWHINYPLACVAIFQYKLEKAETILRAIKEHYLTNGKFRFLFPELCPPDGTLEYGTKAYFDIWKVEQKRSSPRRERSVMTASLDAGLSGYHFEVMKFSDVVETENTETLDQCSKTIDKFGKAEFLLTGKNFWIDVEGTRYHFGDLYGDILKKIEKQKQKGTVYWDVYCRGIFEPNLPAGQTREFSPEELKLPHKLDENGKPIPSFPSELTSIFGDIDMLLTGKEEDPTNFAAQMLNNPIGGRGGIVDFPVILKDGIYEKPNIVPKDAYDKIPKAFSVLAVDFAETVNERSNWTAMILGTVDRMGRSYVEQIVREKLTPKQGVDLLIAMCNKHKPQYLLLEDVNYTRGLKVSIDREWDLNPYNFRPFLKFDKRNNQQQKEERIRLSLYKAYADNDIRFVKDNIPDSAWKGLVEELQEFPKGTSNDILDCISDFMMCRDWYGKEWAKVTDPTYFVNVLSDPGANLAFQVAAGINEISFDSPVDTGISNIMTPDSLVDTFYARFK